MTYPCDGLGPYAYDPNVRVMWTTTSLEVASPAATGVAGAVELNDTYNLTDIIGWEVERNVIDKMVYGPYVTQLAGVRRVSEMQLVFAADRIASIGADIRQLLAADDEGFVLILPSGSFSEYPLAPLNVYPVRVGQVSQLQGLRQAASSIRVTFVLIDDVGESVFVEFT